MASKFVMVLALLGAMVAHGCAPVLLGAGGVIVADQVAEDQGSDLF